MKYAHQAIAKALRTARKQKGLSQRILSEQSGATQSQISRFENGALDARLSTVIDIARVLDLELMLVPKKWIPAVRSITRGPRHDEGPEVSQHRLRKELEAIRKAANQLPVWSPSRGPEYERLRRYVEEFLRLMPVVRLEDLREVRRVLGVASRSGDKATLGKALADLQTLRNRAIHRSIETQEHETERPAYELDDIDDG